MKLSNFASLLTDPSTRRSSRLCSLFPTASLLCLFFFIGSAFLAQDEKEKLFRWGLGEESAEEVQHNKCKNQCRPPGSESLPNGIVSNTSNLQMRPLWGLPKVLKKVNSSNLLSVAVGIKQKDMVDKMVRKFLSSDFVVMLFHYDGIVDQWKDLEWSDHVIHVSAVNQTKWWFAKRFLHPDIVAGYSYIFLWDEDLGVEDFQPQRYLAIVKDEGLEISQPALDPGKSEVHHQITVRRRRSKLHRRIYKPGDGAIRCDENSRTPPCTGWVEVMAPVFSRAAWRCVWYMIQNDLIHAWGLDMQLGYCAQGDRTKNIGVVDSEYIVHHGLPTLGDTKNEALSKSHKINRRVEALTKSHEINHRVEYEHCLPQRFLTVQKARNSHFFTSSLHLNESYRLNVKIRNCGYFASNEFACHPASHGKEEQLLKVRRRSYKEFKIFKRRWGNAAAHDECWIDPYPEPVKQNTN